MISDDRINEIIGESSEARDESLLSSAVSELMKSFDCVQIFANRHEVGSGGTVRGSYGSGNFFSRYGQIKEWVLRQEDLFLSDGDDF